MDYWYETNDPSLPNIVKDPAVAGALRAYRESRDARNLHRLETALSNAGIRTGLERNRAIRALMRSRRWGDGGRLG